MNSSRLKISEAAQPLILIPVEAADVARGRRRRLAIWWGSGILAVTAAALIYKHNVDPIHAQESYDAGVHLLEIARYPQAILSFDRAIDLKTNFADAYLMRARTFAAAGQTTNAISDYSKVIELRPRDPQPLIERGRVYTDGKKIINLQLATRLSARWPWTTHRRWRTCSVAPRCGQWEIWKPRSRISIRQ